MAAVYSEEKTHDDERGPRMPAMIAEAGPAERISDDELQWHRRVVEQRRLWTLIADQWTSHLAAKYGLGIGDSVAEDGRLVRRQQPSGG